ncbi:MAG: hypothetical protein ACRDE2_00580 [Chitinophagaceae bacterium]
MPQFKYTMADEITIRHERKDVTYNWVSTSRFLFYLMVAGSIAFTVAMCYSLWVHRYKGKPNIEVPSNTLYNPVYK